MLVETIDGSPESFMQVNWYAQVGEGAVGITPLSQNVPRPDVGGAPAGCEGAAGAATGAAAAVPGTPTAGPGDPGAPAANPNDAQVAKTSRAASATVARRPGTRPRESLMERPPPAPRPRGAGPDDGTR